ncbi:ribonuclease [Melaminivora sp.]|uniref:ribonuclease n=1 Tax=Melaminivora sp. TaxID=1933032 RepID=UPI0028AB33A6|nr:ribonuclease [Melaminivora sp.]
MLKAVALPACKAFVACAVGVALALPAQARTLSASFPGASIPLAELPAQGRATYALIHAGGPFPYDKDGTVFGNRERLLPAARRGHYREYTVPTPGVRHRGARRIVCGGPPRLPEACYYSGDHYASFRAIAP